MDPRDEGLAPAHHRFFSTLRRRTRFTDPDEAERGISERLERFHTLHRWRTTLGNLSPIQQKLAWQSG